MSTHQTGLICLRSQDLSQLGEIFIRVRNHWTHQLQFSSDVYRNYSEILDIFRRNSMNCAAGLLQSIHAFPFSGCNIDAAKCCNAFAKRTMDKLSDLETVADLVSDKYACDLYWSPWQLPNPVRVKAEKVGRGRHNHETNREGIKCQNTDTAQESKRHRQKEKTPRNTCGN